MEKMSEQRGSIRFCFLLGKTATETHEMLCQAYKADALSRSVTFRWYSRFKEGRQSIEDDSRSGRPATANTEKNIEKVREKVLSDRRITIRELAEEVGIPHATVHSILTETLNMRRISAKFVPKLLNEDQKHARVQTCLELQESARTDPDFIHSIITGDETWVFGYDPETKAQSSQWKSPTSPRPKKARQSRSNVKTLLTVFFDSQGVVHHEFLPQGCTVNQNYYGAVLRRLRESIRRKRPERWRSGKFLLHHDNAPSHNALSIRKFLAEVSMTVVPHPPYSPDLAPNDFFLFPKLKSTLKGARFDDIEAIQRSTAERLKAIPVSEFQRCTRMWQNRWQHCIDSQGNYFEGDNFD